MRTKSTVRVVPRSSCSHWPSPLADQRVARLLSTVLPGRFPSLALAVAAEAGGVISTVPPPDVGVGVGVGKGESVAVGVGVGVGTVTPVGENRLTSVTLLKVPTVLPWPT